MPPGRVAVDCSGPTAHSPQALNQVIARVAVPTARGQSGTAVQRLHCPLPLAREVVRYKSSGSFTANCRPAVRHCIARVPLPTAPRQ